MPLRIHVFQHVPFEEPALIADWATASNHRLSSTRFFAGESPPSADSFDMLIVLGGPMGVDDVEQYTWLAEEAQYLKDILEKKKPVLGICLGAQLIAKALGARVYQGSHKEIGWYPISMLQQNFPQTLQQAVPAEPTVFHWHGDTFDLPTGSTHLACSTATPNQAFICNDRVVGLQFHLETTMESVEKLLEHAGDEVVEGKYIQTAEQMRTTSQHIAANRDMLFAILDYLSREL